MATELSYYAVANNEEKDEVFCSEYDYLMRVYHSGPKALQEYLSARLCSIVDMRAFPDSERQAILQRQTDGFLKI
jgi:hypothetical protein